MTNQPIGVLDSGIGGLTVWQELVNRMPHEDYRYVGDSGFCPYGSKTAAAITQRVRSIVDFLIENRCKIIVVACNAITAASIDFLRGNYPLPFIGMEPAIKPALLETKTRVIGVLATEQTLKGNLFNRTKSAFGQGIEVIEQVGHGLVEKVEALDFDSASTQAALKSLLLPMKARNIDFLVLGCTHYPFLQDAIHGILGDGVTIVNPASAVARHTATTLERLKLNRDRGPLPGRSDFFTTGNGERMRAILGRMKAERFEVRAIQI